MIWPIEFCTPKKVFYGLKQRVSLFQCCYIWNVFGSVLWESWCLTALLAVWISACPSVYLLVSLSACVGLSVSIFLSVCLSASVSVWLPSALDFATIIHQCPGWSWQLGWRLWTSFLLTSQRCLCVGLLWWSYQLGPTIMVGVFPESCGR